MGCIGPYYWAFSKTRGDRCREIHTTLQCTFHGGNFEHSWKCLCGSQRIVAWRAGKWWILNTKVMTHSSLRATTYACFNRSGKSLHLWLMWTRNMFLRLFNACPFLCRSCLAIMKHMCASCQPVLTVILHEISKAYVDSWSYSSTQPGKMNRISHPQITKEVLWKELHSYSITYGYQGDPWNQIHWWIIHGSLRRCTKFEVNVLAVSNN